jgi:plastocyanin
VPLYASITHNGISLGISGMILISVLSVTFGSDNSASGQNFTNNIGREITQGGSQKDPVAPGQIKILLENVIQEVKNNDVGKGLANLNLVDRELATFGNSSPFKPLRAIVKNSIGLLQVGSISQALVRLNQVHKQLAVIGVKKTTTTAAQVAPLNTGIPPRTLVKSPPTNGIRTTTPQQPPSVGTSTTTGAIPPPSAGTQCTIVPGASMTFREECPNGSNVTGPNKNSLLSATASSTQLPPNATSPQAGSLIKTGSIPPLQPSATILVNTDACDQNSQNPMSPRSVTIPVGGTVNWTNNDKNYHQFKSGTPNAVSNLFDSDLIAPGKTSNVVTLKTPGTFNFFDAECNSLQGTINVVAATPTSSAATTPPPTLTPPQTQTPASPALTPQQSVNPIPPFLRSPNANLSSNLKPYNNPVYGISIQYPPNWKVEEGDKFLFGSGVTNVATFIPPGGVSGSKNYHEFVGISIEPSNGTTLADYLNYTINQYAHLPGFNKTLSDTNAVLAGTPAYLLEYSYVLPGYPINVLEVGTIIGDKVYYVSYAADAPTYSLYLPTVYMMIKSLSLSAQNPLQNNLSPPPSPPNNNLSPPLSPPNNNLGPAGGPGAAGSIP